MNKILEEYKKELKVCAVDLKNYKDSKDELERMYELEKARVMLSAEVSSLGSQSLRDAQLTLIMDGKEVTRSFYAARSAAYKAWIDYEVINKLIDIQLKGNL